MDQTDVALYRQIAYFVTILDFGNVIWGYSRAVSTLQRWFKQSLHTVAFTMSSKEKNFVRSKL